MFTVFAVLYGYFVFVSATNLGMLRIKRGSSSSWDPAVLIPARNEEQNLQLLLPAIVPQVSKVYVYDDGSSDRTSEIASQLGATVIRGSDQLPEGWVGKNHACHQLAKVALEDHPGDWMLFLDADTRPGPEFVAGLGSVIEKSRKRVATGMPKLLPGTGIEPAYMSWVVWIIGATNPFGLVRLGGFGHNMFLNGQLIAFHKSTYFDLMPHEAVRSEVLEDVKMGRMLAKNRIPVAVVDVSSVFATQMYRNLMEAFRGMCKNSADIFPGVLGSLILSLMLLTAAWGWIFFGQRGLYLAGALLLSGFFVSRVSRSPLWTVPLLPLALSAGALTVLYSQWLRSTGRRQWKGRTY